MTDDLDKEFTIAIAGAFVAMGIGYGISYWLELENWATVVTSFVSWIVGLVAVTFIMVPVDDRSKEKGNENAYD